MIQKAPIILASKSPRRHELLAQMGFTFKVVLKEVDESFPSDLSPKEIAQFIANKKIEAFDQLVSSEIIITADTIVVLENEILGKPANRAEARSMLEKLSGKKHEVITVVCLMHKQKIQSFFDTSVVYFENLTSAEIDYYLETYKPYDKAGAYGIQEWIGLNKIKRIEGSYTNIVGLPTEKLYKAINEIVISD